MTEFYSGNISSMSFQIAYFINEMRSMFINKTIPTFLYLFLLIIGIKAIYKVFRKV